MKVNISGWASSTMRQVAVDRPSNSSVEKKLGHGVIPASSRSSRRSCPVTAREWASGAGDLGR
jgi:hypothetical protein